MWIMAQLCVIVFVLLAGLSVIRERTSHCDFQHLAVHNILKGTVTECSLVEKINCAFISGTLGATW